MQKIKNIYHLFRAILANIQYWFPSRGLTVIGVTGTDGKTTTASAIYHILRASQYKVSLISTVGAYIDGKFTDTGFHVTTPDSADIQKFCRLSLQKKCKYLVLETTSIGIDQFRDFGINYEVGIITNLSHEHLDYHQNMHNYAKAKFSLLARSKQRLITPNVGEIKQMAKNLNNLHTYSYAQKTEFNQTSFVLPKSITQDFNKENLIGAAAACFLVGVEPSKINSALTTFKLPEGRMQLVNNPKNLKLIVDFGHTPQALEMALQSVKNTYPNHKLISVFGSAGLRDYSKRPEMGKSASKYSDIIILTSEDPRTEDQNLIAKQIVSGFLPQFSKSKKYFIINDRQLAIDKAVSISNNKTVTIFFGKGHEKSINIQGIENPWDEVKAVESAVKKNAKK